MSELVWVDTGDAIVPRVDGYDVAWAPQPGSQTAFLSCPITECCYEGTRGPGKTDALLMDFAQHVGIDDRTKEQILQGAPQTRGWGAEWRGILFRRTYPELQDVIDKSKKWFPRFFPDAVFNEAKTFWHWPTGERLFFRQFKTVSDYWSYHGHAYPWIAWEEMTTWPDDQCYKSMFSCSRSTMPGIPKKIRSTTNPFGTGHNWVKHRFRLPVAPGHIIGEVIKDSVDENGMLEPPRVAIHGTLQENKILLKADPSYVQRLVASAPNAAALEAWLKGSWDIVAGGMFDDVWYHARKYIVIPPFAVPKNWSLDRSFDWGDTKPFSVGWWAESNGEDIVLPNGQTMATVRGDLFRISEWYGWTGKPNEGLKALASEIATGIIKREIRLGIYGRVNNGPADSMIFNETNGMTIAREMAARVRVDSRSYPGIKWTESSKGPGSRIQGAAILRQRMKNAIPTKSGARERPGIFVFNTCKQWIRTVPVLPRSDTEPRDVDDEAEDHAYDETRYRLSKKKRLSRVTTTRGTS